MLGRENLLSREEVMRLQELRGTYGIEAPAPICADPAASRRRGRSDAARSSRRPSGAGQRLVPDVGRAGGGRLRGRMTTAEIRLTYRELSALIEDAIRNLR